MMSEGCPDPSPHAERIDLWLAFFGGIHAEDLLEQYRLLLTEAERAQERRFHFAADRKRFLVTRALVRTVLSRYVSRGPRELEFQVNDYGRPELVQASPAESRLVFNLSHTRDLIVMGVTEGGELGVDTENVYVRAAALEVADRYFAEDEVAALNALRSDSRSMRFFELWTLKESYIKARGMGLSIPLDKFKFDLSADERVSLCIDPELTDDGAAWRIWQIRPMHEYLVAVCARRTTVARPRLITRAIVPLQSETEFSCAVVRTSE